MYKHITVKSLHALCDSLAAVHASFCAVSLAVYQTTGEMYNPYYLMAQTVAEQSRLIWQELDERESSGITG
jgi:hypothetical protein